MEQLMSETTPLGKQVVAQLNFDEFNLKLLESAQKRACYRAAINWLRGYQPRSDEPKIQQFRHILEAFNYLCMAKDIERAFKLFTIQIPPHINGKLYDQLYIWGEYDSLLAMALRLMELLDSSPKTGQQLHHLKIVCLGSLGIVELLRGNYKNSIDHYNQQVEISALVQDLPWKASALIGLGQNFKLLGKYSEAHQSYLRAQRIAIELADRKLEMAATSGLGSVQSDLGQYDLASIHFKEQLEIAGTISDGHEKIQAFANIGNIYSLTGEHEAAVEIHLIALKITHVTENLEGEAKISALLGFAFYIQQEYRAAISFYKRSLAISRSIGLFLQEAESLEKVGVLEGKLADSQIARDSSLDNLNQALDKFRKAGIPSGEARVMKEIAEAYDHFGEVELALQYCENALIISREQKLPLEDACIYLAAKITASKSIKTSTSPRFTEIDLNLYPSLKDEIDVVLLTATDIELDAVRNKMSLCPREKKRFKVFVEQETYYVGKFGAFKAVVTKCRMGTIGSAAATLATERALRTWKPKAIIMIGIAFGKDPEKQNIGDVLIASEIIPYDSQRRGKNIQYRAAIPPSNATLLNRFENVPDWKFLNLEGSPCRRHVGAILSGDKLIDDPKFKSELFRQFPHAIGGEMEGSGLCSAAIGADVPWILVKSICDWADGAKNSTHQNEDQQLAADAAVSLVHEVLSQKTVLNFKLAQ
jgi:nucleoside phosphorylase